MYERGKWEDRKGPKQFYVSKNTEQECNICSYLNVQISTNFVMFT